MTSRMLSGSAAGTTSRVPPGSCTLTPAAGTPPGGVAVAIDLDDRDGRAARRAEARVDLAKDLAHGKIDLRVERGERHGRGLRRTRSVSQRVDQADASLPIRHPDPDGVARAPIRIDRHDQRGHVDRTRRLLRPDLRDDDGAALRRREDIEALRQTLDRTEARSGAPAGRVPIAKGLADVLDGRRDVADPVAGQRGPDPREERPLRDV